MIPNMKRVTCILFLLWVMLVPITLVSAQVNPAPQLMNFQGRLTKPDGTPVPNSNYAIRFSLWNALSGGTEKWNQTINNVTVTNGTFAVLLNVGTGPADLFAADRWLEIKIGKDAPLTPRQQLVSVAFALKANTVPDGSITGAKIANSTITADKLANNALNNLSWLLSGNVASASHFLGTTNSQPLVFKTNNTERMRLLANGNLGIGTDSPGALLHVNGSAKINGNNILEFGADQIKEINAGKIGYQTFSGDALDIVGAGGKVVNRKLHVFAEGGSIFEGGILTKGLIVNGKIGINTTQIKGQLHNTGRYYGLGNVLLYANDGDGVNGTAYIQAGDDSFSSSVGMQLQSQKGGFSVDAIRIAPNGNTGVRGVDYSNVSLTAWANGNYWALYSEGYFGVNGSAFADFWFLNSDAHFKQNIQTLDNALDTILRLRGVSYEWKDPKKGKGSQVGFIAQEVEEILPQIVGTRPDGYKGVSYQSVVPVLVEAVKTLKAQSDAKQRQLDDKQKQIDALSAKLEALQRVVEQIQAQQTNGGK